MRIVCTEDLKVGMKLAKPVYNSNGSLLLQDGVELKSRYILQLEKQHIPTVYIEDSISEGIEIVNVIDDKVKIEAINKMKSQFDILLPENENMNRKTLIPSNNYNELKHLMENILGIVEENSDNLMVLSEIMSTDIYTYEHSINVAVLSVLIGLELKYDRKKLIDLGLGALLHDIGKLKIDKSILHKPSRLTKEEYDQMKLHAEYGYEMVKDTAVASALVKSIILLHHEKLDGSGYPKGLKKDELENKEYVKIVTITDILDALINDRVYKERMPIYKAVELISCNVPEQLDKKLFHMMKNKIAPFPPGTAVLLSTGEKALVVKTNYSRPTRPVVKVIFDNNGLKYNKFKTIDLMNELTMFIIDTTKI